MDDDFNYISLAALTANVMRYLIKEEDVKRQAEYREDKQRPEADPRAGGQTVDQALNDKAVI